MTVSSPHDGVSTARRSSGATLPVIVDTTVEMISSPAPLLTTKSQGKEPPAKEAPKVASYNRPTYAAFICFGLCSWVMTNTTFVEMSHFMLHLPEKLSVVSYAMFALQTANIYPILYMFLNPQHKRLSLATASWLCLALGLLVCLLMSFLWDRTATVFGEEHSVAMLVLSHIGGAVSATTSVIFFPYVATFPPLYTSALATGEGLSGTLAGLLGYWQAPYAEEMYFSVTAFYLACAIIVLASALAFAFLEFHPIARRERNRLNPTRRKSDDIPQVGEDTETDRTTDEEKDTVELITHDTPQLPRPSLRNRVFHTFWKDLIWQSVLSALFYGIIPSVSSFLFVRYTPNPEKASMQQSHATIALFFIDPLARFLTSFYRIQIVYHASALLVVVGGFLVLCTLMTSPPGSSNVEHGYLFPVMLYIGSSGLFGYTQTMLMLNVKQRADDCRDPAFAEAAYQWSGFLIQMGSFLGTLVIFPFILFYPQLFQAESSHTG